MKMEDNHVIHKLIEKGMIYKLPESKPNEEKEQIIMPSEITFKDLILETIKLSKHEIIRFINFKVKDLKKRKNKLIHPGSKYAMEMSINELEELKKEIQENP